MDKHQAIYKLYPNVTHIRGDIAYDKDEQEVIYDNASIDLLIASEAYKNLRAVEYPSLANQLDMLWHAIDTGSLSKDSEFYKTLKMVKDKYPKE